MLDSIRILGFRSIDDVTIPLNQRVIALLGKNGAGKTAILQAIQLAADLCVGKEDAWKTLWRMSHRRFKAISLWITLDSRKFEYVIECCEDLEGRPKVSERLSCGGKVLFRREGKRLEYPFTANTNETSITSSMSALSLLLRLIGSEADRNGLRDIAQFLSAVRYYPLLQEEPKHESNRTARTLEPLVDFENIIDSTAYTGWKENSEFIAAGSVLLRLIDLSLVEGGRQFNQLKELLGRDGLGIANDLRIQEVPYQELSIGESSGKGFRVLFQLGAEVGGTGEWLLFRSLSAGTQRVIQLLTYLFYDESACMLIEHPEESVHPSLMHKLFEILTDYSDRTQIIVSTHSPTITNSLPAEAIQRVFVEGGRTRVAALTQQQVNAAGEFVADHGTLAEYLELL